MDWFGPLLRGEQLSSSSAHNKRRLWRLLSKRTPAKPGQRSANKAASPGSLCRVRLPLLHYPLTPTQQINRPTADAWRSRTIQLTPGCQKAVRAFGYASRGTLDALSWRRLATNDHLRSAHERDDAGSAAGQDWISGATALRRDCHEVCRARGQH